MPIDWNLAVQPQNTLRSALAGYQTGQQIGQERRRTSTLSALLANPSDPAAQRNALAVDPEGAMSAIKGVTSLRDLARADARRAAYNEAWNPETGTVDRQALGNRLAASGDAEGAVEAMSELAKLDEQARKLDSATLKALGDQMEFVGRLANGVDDQTSWEAALAEAASANVDVSRYPRQFDPSLVEQIRAKSLSGKEMFDYHLRLRGEERQQRATEDLIRHRAVIEDRGERRIGLTADRNATLERQGEARLNKPDRVGVVDRVLEKVAAGEELTDGEIRVLEYSKSGQGRRGGARGGFVYSGPRTVPAGAEVDGNAVSASAPSLPPAQARTTPPRPNPSAPGRTSGGRFNLPAGYTPQRVVTEARAAIKSGKDPAYIRRQLQSYGINPKVLDR